MSDFFLTEFALFFLAMFISCKDAKVDFKGSVLVLVCFYFGVWGVEAHVRAVE